MLGLTEGIKSYIPSMCSSRFAVQWLLSELTPHEFSRLVYNDFEIMATPAELFRGFLFEEAAAAGSAPGSLSPPTMNVASNRFRC